MAHVFIVNEQTFKLHLEYQFAGTGASDISTDFIFDNSIKINTQNEKRSVLMMADVLRIRKGDKIIFFVTGISKFYGVFEAASVFFLDPNDHKNYLGQKLGKILTYRLLIKPYKVYEKGLSEFDALDSLQGVKYPDEICWSLIYRKLDGNRGCTMITDQEYAILFKKLQKNNQLLQSKKYTYDDSKKKIIPSTHRVMYKKKPLNIDDQLESNMLYKYQNKKAFEHYLEFWIIRILKSKQFNQILPSSSPVSWIGNEVMCSFGKRRIDIIALQEQKKEINISLIELKDEQVDKTVTEQLKGYLRWIIEYMLPIYLRKGYKANIWPIIVSDGISKALPKTKEKLSMVEGKIKSYDWSCYNSPSIKVSPIKIIHFTPRKSGFRLTDI